MTSIDHLPKETKVLPIHDHLFLLFSQYVDRTLQCSNYSQYVITSSSGFQRHETHLPISVPPSCCYVFLERYSPTIISKTEIKWLHNATVSQSRYFLYPKSVLQTSSPQTSTEKVIFPPGTGLPFSSAVHPFAVIPSTFCHSWGKGSQHIGSPYIICVASHIPDRKDLWEHLCLESELLIGFPFIDFPSLPTPKPLPSNVH